MNTWKEYVVMGLRRIQKGSNGIFFNPKVANRKLAPTRAGGKKGKSLSPIRPYIAGVTWPIRPTCPPCPHKDVDCYAQGGAQYRRLENSLRGITGAAVMAAVLAELHAYMDMVEKIPDDGTGRPRCLRLPIAGDFLNAASAVEFAEAERRWRSMGGGRWFGSTQNWRAIDRDTFGEINIFASVSSEEEIAEARERGYAPWLTREEHPDGPKPTQLAGTKIVACLAQTMKVGPDGKRQAAGSAPRQPGWRNLTCVECRLCLDKDLFTRNEVVAFAEHGTRARIRSEHRQNLVQLVSHPRPTRSDETEADRRFPISIYGVDGQRYIDDFLSPRQLAARRNTLLAIRDNARLAHNYDLALAADWGAKLIAQLAQGLPAGKFEPFERRKRPPPKLTTPVLIQFGLTRMETSRRELHELADQVRYFGGDDPLDATIIGENLLRYVADETELPHVKSDVFELIIKKEWGRPRHAPSKRGTKRRR